MIYVREAPPPRLYKYQPFSGRTLTALKVRTIWFGSPSSFNDPFDFAVPVKVKAVTLDDCRRLMQSKTDAKWQAINSDRRYVDANGAPTEEFRHIVEDAGEKAYRAKASESYWNRGVTCFSERPDDTLLWSHYGGGHRGICLEFDTTSPLLEKIHKVLYSDDVPQVDVVDELLGGGGALIPQLLTKATCWSYEREWRAIHMQAGTAYCYGVDALTGVYLGAQLTSAEKDLVCHILHGSPTQIYEARRADGSLKLDVRPLTYTPYRYA